MTSTIQLGLGGASAPDDLCNAVQMLEVEENVDRPDALLLRLPVNRTSKGDLQFVGDGTFDPYTNITVVVTPPGKSSQCIFDGFVLSWHLHLDRTSGSSTIEVWAQDASWLMSRNDTVREWSGLTDGQVANQIFSSHGFTPAQENTKDDSPQHDPSGHSLFQRSTDLQFLRGLARRNGKLCRVACEDTPGDRVGYFITPAVEGDPVATITLLDPESWSVDSLEFDWDVMRPSEVDASQVPLNQSSNGGVAGDAVASGLAPLDERDYETYAGQPTTLLLTATADVPELRQRSAATLRDAGWFVRCRGETNVDRLGATLRAGTVVAVEGAGSLHSGNWFVWSVRHRISVDVVKLEFTLVRNAMGPATGGSLLGAIG
jgi:phage protein D